MNTDIEKLAEIINKSENIVFFGGAGVSTASGIPDFRSSNGIFSKRLNAHFTPEELVSHTFYSKYPDEFYDFYKKNLIYPAAKPNSCHTALYELERVGKLKAIVTQNIDGLHQSAGSKVVYELHGSVKRNYCTGCGKFYDEKYVLEANGVPRCEKCSSIIKPDVVLYEESLDDDVVSGAIRAISTCDLLIVGGTSLVVYPAAGLVRYFRGKHLALINMTVTQADNMADIVIHDKIEDVMAAAVKLAINNAVC